MNFSKDALKFLFENTDKSSEAFEPDRFLPEKLTLDGFPTTNVFVQAGVLCAAILEGSAPSEVSMILGIGNHANHVYSLSVLEDTTTFIVANKTSLKACDLELADKLNYPDTGFTDHKNKNGVQQARKVYLMHNKDVTALLAAFKNGISQKPVALLQNLDNISKGFSKWLRAACFNGRSPANSQVEIPTVKISGGQIPPIVWTNLINDIEDIKTNHPNYGAQLVLIFQEFLVSPPTATDTNKATQEGTRTPLRPRLTPPFNDNDEDVSFLGTITNPTPPRSNRSKTRPVGPAAWGQKSVSKFDLQQPLKYTNGRKRVSWPTPSPEQAGPQR